MASVRNFTKTTNPDMTHGTAVYADQARGGARGVNGAAYMAVYGSPMECLEKTKHGSARACDACELGRSTLKLLCSTVIFSRAP